MAREAGNTVSIRLPPGMAEKLRAASGMKVSTLLRKMAQAYLAQAEMQAAKKQKEEQSDGQ